MHDMQLALQLDDGDLDEIQTILDRQQLRHVCSIHTTKDTNTNTQEMVRHDEVLVGPHKQLENVGAMTIRAFARIICERYKVMTSNAEKDPTLEGVHLFDDSFTTKQHADRIANFVRSTLNSHAFRDTLVLPPSILRSEEDVLFKLPGVAVVCHRDGPVIPVVLRGKDAGSFQDVLDIILQLYTLESSQYVNSGNFAKLFRPAS